jgi:hypothetical protein
VFVDPNRPCCYEVVVVTGGAVVVVGGGAVVVVGGGAVVVVGGGAVVVVGGGAVVVVCGRVVVVVDELLVVVVVGVLELDPEVRISTMMSTIRMTARAAISHGHQFRFFSPSSSWPPGGCCPGGW